MPQFAYQANSRILGLDRDIFAQVTEVKFTVYYCLIGIAQALKEVPQDLMDSEPNVPWGSIVGKRKRFIHAYWRIDDDIVYDVASLELPALNAALQRMIKRLT